MAALKQTQLIPELHIAGLATRLETLTKTQRESLNALEALVSNSPPARGNADFLTPAVMVRFLIARDWDVDRAHDMLLEALCWRLKQPAHRWFALDASDDDEARARTESIRRQTSTGKIHVPGVDAHGRAILVLNNSRENTISDDESMLYLGWNMELAMRTMALTGKKCDKIVVFVHMSDFSIWNQPSLAVTKATLTILSTVHPQSLGTAIILDPPSYFLTFWEMVSGLIDPKTKSKVAMVFGDSSDGSENDLLLQDMIGPNWKELTGAGRPIISKGFSEKHGKEIDASPGFDADSYWKTVQTREVSSHKEYLERTKELKLVTQASGVPAEEMVENLSQENVLASSRGSDNNNNNNNKNSNNNNATLTPCNAKPSSPAEIVLAVLTYVVSVAGLTIWLVLVALAVFLLSSIALLPFAPQARKAKSSAIFNLTFVMQLLLLTLVSPPTLSSTSSTGVTLKATDTSGDEAPRGVICTPTEDLLQRGTETQNETTEETMRDENEETSSCNPIDANPVVEKSTKEVPTDPSAASAGAASSSPSAAGAESPSGATSSSAENTLAHLLQDRFTAEDSGHVSPQESTTAARAWALRKTVLRRYLRAGRGNAGATVPFLLSSYQWRAEHGVDALLKDSHVLALEKSQRSLLKYHLSRCEATSTCGPAPLLIERVGAWDIPALVAAIADQQQESVNNNKPNFPKHFPSKLTLGHVVVNELLQEIAAEAISTSDSSSIDPLRAVIVFDLEGLGWALLAARSIHALFSVLSTLDTNHYPDSTGVIVIVNASSLFSTLSSIVLRFVHPDTRAKVHVFAAGSSSGTSLSTSKGSGAGRVGTSAALELRRLCGEGALPAELGGTLPPASPPYCY